MQSYTLISQEERKRINYVVQIAVSEIAPTQPGNWFGRVGPVRFC